MQLIDVMPIAGEVRRTGQRVDEEVRHVEGLQQHQQHHPLLSIINIIQKLEEEEEN